MGSSSSSPLDIVAGVATGGVYTAVKYMNDKRIEANRAMRTAADQQKDAMIAQENELKNRQKEAKKTAGNLALRQRLIATRAASSPSTRGGTLVTGPNGIPGTTPVGTKTLLGS